MRSVAVLIALNCLRRNPNFVIDHEAVAGFGTGNALVTILRGGQGKWSMQAYRKRKR